MTTQPTKSPTSWSGLQVALLSSSVIEDFRSCSIQPYEVMKAVEQRDIMFLMQVRDNAFHVGLLFYEPYICAYLWPASFTKLWW